MTCGRAGGMPLIASSPVKYQGFPLIISSVAEQEALEAFHPGENVFRREHAVGLGVDRQLRDPGVDARRLAGERDPELVGSSGRCTCLYSPCFRLVLALLAVSAFAVRAEPVRNAGHLVRRRLALRDDVAGGRIGSTTTPGAVGTRYGGFAGLRRRPRTRPPQKSRASANKSAAVRMVVLFMLVKPPRDRCRGMLIALTVRSSSISSGSRLTRSREPSRLRRSSARGQLRGIRRPSRISISSTPPSLPP